MKRFYILFIIPFLFTCAKKQPEASWLIVEPWELIANPDVGPNDHGALTHNVTEAFISMDGQLLGAFSLPAKIPVIGEGSHSFILIPGVKNNGISATKRRYPFLQQYSASIELFKDDTVVMAPTTMYYKELTFKIEDFEDATMDFEEGSGSTASLVKGDDAQYLQWGNSYGEIQLNDSNSLLSIVSEFVGSMPKQGAEVYLELDFLNTNSVLTSVISYGNGTYHDDPYIQLNPQDNPVWKHIYIDLKEIVSTRSTSPFNEVSFNMTLDEEGTNKFVLLDNIKVIHL
ncbi:MAG: hypothetical protein COA32_11505 [Fluviicola sp.]|nr:MAG: hypothetical protein COA32_11505 [Fluviicola sp.]